MGSVQAPYGFLESCPQFIERPPPPVTVVVSARGREASDEFVQRAHAFDQKDLRYGRARRPIRLIEVAVYIAIRVCLRDPPVDFLNVHAWREVDQVARESSPPRDRPLLLLRSGLRLEDP